MTESDLTYDSLGSKAVIGEIAFVLQIRQEQMRAFSEQGTDAFVREACLHLRNCWPKQAAQRGEEGVRASVLLAIQRAGLHGINSKRGVVRYLDVMYLLGEDFDRDPGITWAARILNHPTMPGWAKADRLWAEAKLQAPGSEPVEPFPIRG